MNSSDCAKRILFSLDEHSAGQTQLALSQQLDMPIERLNPVITGLAHNRYILRDFSVPGTLVTLTDEGRKWIRGENLNAAGKTLIKERSESSTEYAAFTDFQVESAHSGMNGLTEAPSIRQQRRPANRSSSLDPTESRTVQVVRRTRRAAAPVA